MYLSELDGCQGPHHLLWDAAQSAPGGSEGLRLLQPFHSEPLRGALNTTGQVVRGEVWGRPGAVLSLTLQYTLRCVASIFWALILHICKQGPGEK